MPTNRPPQGLEEADYETIEAAVMETARGRWFLAEHARRTREAETARMLDAIGQIEKLVREQSQPRPDSIDRQDAARLLGMIEERLLDLSWMMKARGLDPAFCELVDREAARIGRALDRNAGLEPPDPLPPLLAPVDLQSQSVAPTPQLEAPPVEVAEPPVQPVAVIVPTEPPPEPRPLRLEALAFLDRMTPRERQRFFA